VKYFLILDNEVIVSHLDGEGYPDVAYLFDCVMRKYPDATAVVAGPGQHTEMPWEIDTVFVIPYEASPDGVRSVAYLWKEIQHLQCRKAREERWVGQVEATCIARSLMP
jgi:hypothetical protein